MTAAERQRQYRQRRRDGVVSLTVRIGPEVIEALLKRGMPDADSRDRKAVARECAAVLQEWAEHWLRDA